MIKEFELIKSISNDDTLVYRYSTLTYTYNVNKQEIIAGSDKELFGAIPFDSETQTPQEAIIEHINLLISQNTIEQKDTDDAIINILNYNNINYKFDDIYDFLINKKIDTQIIYSVLNKLNITEMFTSISSYKKLMILENSFNQIAKISTLDVDVQIEVDLKHTVHSMERQGRSGDYVKNSDIKDTVNLASEQIVHALLKDRIDINEPIWIFNSTNNLNVVGSLSAVNTATNKYVFKVITVMFNKDFYNSKKTYKITI